VQAGDLHVPLKALSSLGEQSKHLMQPTTIGGGAAASAFFQAVAPKLTVKSAARRTAAC